ncbi:MULTISPECIES: hypothetical protein [Actinoalloteichus]|uniref:PH domain-containing protein n=1 Tax=Actinoalloteichus fjordicus TaxID=1612552 RepID=A0AAC9LDT7_9PSEU|nr:MULTISPECIES: hypothetical protein [Actinoalloteichus]APU14500.1 hypothetical protein UA74_12200 [Actinoalloteichus fjordicus]APU20468.1 hypothetical protein UA75_12280 [Actinoalloteichus sp. GBA129-24]
MDRLLLTLAFAAFFALCAYGMWRGWHRRAADQAGVLPPLPEPAAALLDSPDVLPALTGVYIGTTSAENWQARVLAGDFGHRSAGALRLIDDGVLIERDGAGTLWLPAHALRDARIDSKSAGKVVPGGGLLVLTWQHGDFDLDTAFRADDKSDYERWVDRLREKAAPEASAEPAGEPGADGASGTDDASDPDGSAPQAPDMKEAGR